MPGTTRNNISYAAIIDADIDADAFGAAIDLLARRHETLRTTLVFEDNMTWQIIHDEPLGKLETADFSDLPLELARQRASDRAHDMAATPCDVATGPLVRVALLRLAPRLHMVAVVAHHAVADGWSLAIAMQEVATLYQSVLDGTEPELRELPIQYRDYAEWEYQWLQTQEAKEHAEYWDNRLRHIAAPRLPRDHGEPPAERSGGIAAVSLSPELTAAVREFASGHDVSVYNVLLAAVGLLIAERTGREDVYIGTAVANRHEPQTHQLIGLFAGVVPILFTAPPHGTFSSLAREVRASCANALSHEAFPLSMYLGRVEVGRDLRERPLYTAVFVLQPPMLPFTLGGKTFSPVQLDRGAAMSEFTLHLWDRGSVISGNVGYSARVISDVTAGAMIARYLEILSRAMADPGRPLAEL
jgi:hypothetical protein